MKRIILILCLVTASEIMAKSTFCQSSDKKIKVLLEVKKERVTSIKSYKSISLDYIQETLPAAIYENHQEINQDINWYFEQNAKIKVSILEKGLKARFRVIGKHQYSPRVIVLSKTLNCKS